MSAPGPPILIVDDNLDAREMYGMYLEHEGFRWAEAVNGQEALTRARDERPALILMDATMPRMDGWEAVRRLKEDPQTQAIPLIMLPPTRSRSTGTARRRSAPTRSSPSRCCPISSPPKYGAC